MSHPRLAMMVQTTAIATCVWSALTLPAHAYIDPISTGAFLQSVAVAVASTLIFIAALPHKVAAMVRSVRDRIMPRRPEPVADADAGARPEA